MPIYRYTCTSEKGVTIHIIEASTKTEAKYKGARLHFQRFKEKPKEVVVTEENPRKNKMTKIYDKTLRIEAVKGKESMYPGEKFFHDFKDGSAAAIYGLPDGSLLIKSKKGKRLWSNIKQKE